MLYYNVKSKLTNNYSMKYLIMQVNYKFLGTIEIFMIITKELMLSVEI